MSFHKQLYKAYIDDLSSDSFEEYLVDKLETITALLSIQGETLERYEAALNAVLATMPAKVNLPLVIEIKQIVTVALKEAE